MPPNRNDATAAGDSPLPQTLSVHPLRISLAFSISYFVICTLYIWLSSLMAARLSSSVEALQHIETIKGISFIFLSTVSIFLILFFLFKRLSMDEQKIIEQQQNLIKSRQEATAGIFASSIAHDINNILIVLDHYCSLLLQADNSEAVYPETGEKVRYAISELKNLSHRLMNIGRGNLPHEFSNFDLPKLIKDTMKLIRKHKAVHGSTLEYSGTDNLQIMGNESIFRQLLLNLILNAAQAITGRGNIEIVCSRTDQIAIIEVHDSGSGISAEDREKIFNPFYSTREEGTGLGLLSVKVYAEIHKGWVIVSDSHLGGACFRVEIPLTLEKTDQQNRPLMISPE